MKYPDRAMNTAGAIGNQQHFDCSPTAEKIGTHDSVQALVAGLASAAPGAVWLRAAQVAAAVLGGLR